MMKTTQKITRVKLKVNHKDESALIGIVSAEPDYKLSLALNKKLKISLKSAPPVVLPEGSGSGFTFSRFSDAAGSQGLAYVLISNRHGKNFLLKKLKNVDYIFRIYNPDNEANKDKIITSIRSAECVTAVFNLDPESLKDKNLQFITQ
jgi:hypothetical protein